MTMVGDYATNINTMAEKANISIGSMYSYFASKEDLFLAIVDEGLALFYLDNLNDRITIYFGWFKDKIEEKLKEGYILDIIEVNKSYWSTREELLKTLDIEYGDDILVLDIQDL